MEKNNYKKVQQVLLIILVANLAVAFMKIALGYFIKSASMTADGFHSLSDGSSNIVGIVGIKLAAKPQDEDHPYGHHKYETMTGLLISAMLFIVAGSVIQEAIGRFRNPVKPDITLFSLAVLLLTLVINIYVTITENRQGKLLNSPILISDAMHTRSDIYVSVGVLTTLIGIKLGLPPIIDPIASLIVGGFIIYAGYEIFKENSDVLLDRAMADANEIRDLVSGFEDVIDIHKIRSRGTQNNLSIDFHLHVDPQLSVARSHELIHEIEAVIREKINESAQVFVHFDPYQGQTLKK
jgi:cation diffusion facilitator family transporter